MERTRGTNQFEQLQLFDTGPRVEPHPGDLRPDQWMARPDVQYHGIAHDASRRMNRVPMQQNPTLYRHFGTEQSARDRISADNPLVSTGDIHSRRIPGLDTTKPADPIPGEMNRSGLGRAFGINENAFPSRDEDTGETFHSEHGLYRYSDRDTSETNQLVESYVSSVAKAQSEDTAANLAEKMARGRASLVPNNLEDQDVFGKASKLQAGEPVSYINSAENFGSVSHVVRSDVPKSYAQDVAESPNRPEHVRNWASRMAARELTDPSPTVSNFRTQKQVSSPSGGFFPYGQLSMFREMSGSLAFSSKKQANWVQPDKSGGGDA